ncbi:PP2C family protein-serine/threonine phosphatase [Marinobacterium arenosum]|uniref:PP2C family protein-serine/threonine phosphatase n=1 Tax=Marinobacterium arenosum TaxID=2862496 RepID=UPI001C9643BB|nr:SpoIIE family protein phosphatase [Marinobacterium arenosum]MBY4677895.1 SpoIIE family protein phosphatase [Marinobacterium arenosum]
MSHPCQSILLLHPSSQVVDRVFAILDEAELPPVRITTAFSYSEAVQALAERRFSLIIAFATPELDRQLEELVSLQDPRPVLALLEGQSSCEVVMQSLRQGASDVFLVDTMVTEAQAFAGSVIRFLERARLVDDTESYREQLERSLDELESDQAAARHIQHRMLPNAKMQALPGIGVRYDLTPSLYLSGDFVDVVTLDKRYCMFYLADVSGHGASSALVTVLLKNMANRLARNFRRGSSFDVLSPTSTLKRINHELLETGLGKHLTMFVGLFDLKTECLHYAVGGHHPMPLISTAEGSDYLAGRGMPVGLFDEPVFDEHAVKLPEAFRLTLFSDGILEVLPQESLEQKEQYLRRVVEETGTDDPIQLKQALLGGEVPEAPDDIAIMILARQ